MARAVITCAALGGHTKRRVATSKTANCIGVGCSGSDPIWNNGGIAWIVEQVLGTAPKFDKCSTPGAPISWHMANAPSFGVYGWQNLANYEFLHIGDNPNLDGIHDPTILHQWAQKFWAEGKAGAGGETLLWTLQPGLRSDDASLITWMNNAEVTYNRAQDYCNARIPAGQRLVRQIPGLQLFRRFHADQLAGRTPNSTWFTDLYLDGFHIVYGKIALIASFIGAACMYGIDPALMPADMGAASGFTSAEVQYIKSSISATVKAFDRAGVDTRGWQ